MTANTKKADTVDSVATFGNVPDAPTQSTTSLAAPTPEKPMERLTRSTLKLKKGFNLKRVDLPELGGFLFVRDLPGRRAYDISQVQAAEGEKADNFKRMVDLVMECTCEEDGSRVFVDNSEDRTYVEGMPFGATLKLATSAMQVNGLTADGVSEYREK